MTSDAVPSTPAMVDLAAWLFIVLLAAVAAVHHRWLRALWFRQEDPRPVALLRIATGALLLAWLLDLAPIWDYLWSNEGLLTGAEARARFSARRPLSLLYDYDSPRAVRIYVGVMVVSCTALTVGLLTRVAAWVTLILLLGLLARNAVSLGGEQVFTSFLFYLALARCGAAYSVDAWIARHRHPDTPPPTIPAWPRTLMILQLVPMFFVNGMAKHGPSWATGDTVYYLLHHPAFGPGPVWGLSASLGPWPTRLMTWGAHLFELLVPLVIVGWVMGVARTLSVPGLSAPMRNVHRGLLLALGADIIVLSMVGLPPRARGTLPFTVGIVGGAALATAPLWLPWARRVPERWRPWILGRRVWVTAWVTFAGTLFFVMNLGWFTGLTLCAAVVLIDDERLPRRAPAPPVAPTPRPWRRRAIAALCAMQMVSIAAVSLPTSRPAWRTTLERPLRLWIGLTTSFQVWRMFAPSTSPMVTDLEVELVDATGQVRGVGAGLVDLPSSRWSRDKREKIRGRIASHRQGKQYWSAHAAYVCRRYAGVTPRVRSVRLVRHTVPTPRPEALVALGVDEALAQREHARTRRPLYERDCP
ncbi:MAG: hypothetical protein K0V04_35940 [Deltaproteobacteria bacterium]|nr:hypothetical protein [Deltaproteobacteria bacterium]